MPHELEQPAELKQVLEKVRQHFEQGERVQRPYRDRWDRYYGLYRNYRRLIASHASAESDRDNIIRNAQREWGAELFIPYCFAAIETIVPRILLNPPKMIVRPRSDAAKDAVAPVRELLNFQQSDISYDLKLQPTVRRGLKYGIGAQKTFWERKTKRVVRARPRLILPGMQAIEEEVVLREGPQVEDVDIWDLFWDPNASSIENCGWIIHRTWRNMDYIKRKVESGEWFPVDLKKVEGMGSLADRGESFRSRMEAAGIQNFDTRTGRLHEVWEYHDGERVHTILDRQLVVQNERTPFWHRELPFQIYRPTIQEGEFVGIGEIEPIAHLQYEMNTLRSQRRDNATIVLQKPFMYTRGLIDPDQLKIGPGLGIEVLGDPRSVIVPLDIGEIPHSGYAEEAALKADIERAIGISDSLAGGEGSTPATDTATGIQLVQQAASVRIELKVRTLEQELIRPAARHFLELNRQHFSQAQDIPVPDSTQQEGVRFERVAPEQLAQDLEVIPDAGSTAPTNFIEKQNAALQLYQVLATNPTIDQRALAEHLLLEFELRDPEQFLVPETPQLDPRLMGHALERLGVKPDVILEATEATIEAQQAAESGEGASQNGAAPQPQEQEA